MTYLGHMLTYPSATWWRGVAAACVIGISTLVVIRMQLSPEATV